MLQKGRGEGPGQARRQRDTHTAWVQWQGDPGKWPVGGKPVQNGQPPAEGPRLGGIEGAEYVLVRGNKADTRSKVWTLTLGTALLRPGLGDRPAGRRAGSSQEIFCRWRHPNGNKATLVLARLAGAFASHLMGENSCRKTRPQRMGLTQGASSPALLECQVHQPGLEGVKGWRGEGCSLKSMAFH